MRRWWLLWLLLLVVPPLTLAPYLRSSTEVVRMRNALLLDAGNDAAVPWTPPQWPAGFATETAPPPAVFSAVAAQLGLAAMPDDWTRALAISRHQLGSQPELKGGPIQSDLQSTYRRIVGAGDGYCADFVRAFTAIANAAGMPLRAWAFSFDGFGGHGHVMVEIWNRQVQRWQLVDIFQNYYFVNGSDAPLSAMQFRKALRDNAPGLQLRPLYAGARAAYSREASAWSYFRNGLPQWYLWWGNNVYSYDAASLVHALGPLSRSLEQLGGIAQGVHPRLVVLREPGNARAFDRLGRTRIHVLAVGAVSGLAALVLVATLLRRRTAVRAGR